MEEKSVQLVDPETIEEEILEDQEGDEQEESEDDVSDDASGNETAEDGDEDGQETEQEAVTLQTITLDDGSEYEVDEAIAKAVMLNKDYTQKSQANAELSRRLAEREQQIEESSKRSEEDFQMEAQLYQLNDQLKQYENVDWGSLNQSMALEEVQGHWMKFQQLQNQKNDLQKKVSDRQTERSQAAQSVRSKRVEETRQWAEKNIEGWSPDLANQMEAYAIEQGFDQESFLTNLSPALLKTLHDGFTGNKIKQKAATIQKAQKAKTIVKKVAGKSKTETNPKDLSGASMDDYVKARKSGRNPRLSA